MVLPGGLSVWEALALLLVALVLTSAVIGRIHRMRVHRRRRALLASIGRERGARVLTLVHGKAPVSVVGRPVYSMIDSDDAEAVLRGIRAAGERPIDLVLHTPGGQYHASLQIARALRGHKARTRVLVPHMAMSGGTLIALGADEIVMDANAIMGAVDPQVGDIIRGWRSVTSWIRVAREKGRDADDATLAIAAEGERILEGTRRALLDLVAGKVADPQPLLARLLEGGEAHAFPMSPREMRELGLPVSTDLPRAAHDVIETYRGPRRHTVDAA